MKIQGYIVKFIVIESYIVLQEYAELILTHPCGGVYLLPCDRWKIDHFCLRKRKMRFGIPRTKNFAIDPREMAPNI